MKIKSKTIDIKLRINLTILKPVSFPPITGTPLA